MIFVAASPAAAQLALPGAVAPNPPGAVERLPSASKTPKPAAAYASPSAETVVGRLLLLNGATGALQFSGRSDALRIDRFAMLGEVISDSTQQCQIDVGGGTPIEAKSLGRPDGLLRFAADIPACPFEFDLLDGAVLVPPQLRACIFKEADCQASPSGLWGPSGASLAANPKPVAEARARVEAALAANYRALDARLQDRAKADDLARDEARFSSDHEETCRDYSRESAHSFCATRLTESRAAFLKARIDELTPIAVKREGAPKHSRKLSQ